jgi:hypothetical protein
MQRAAAVVTQYLPHLEDEFGADVAAQVVGRAGLGAWSREVTDMGDLDEPAEPIRGAAAYPRDHTDATVDEAFAAVLKAARERAR